MPNFDLWSWAGQIFSPLGGRILKYLNFKGRQPNFQQFFGFQLLYLIDGNTLSTFEANVGSGLRGLNFSSRALFSSGAVSPHFPSSKAVSFYIFRMYAFPSSISTKNFPWARRGEITRILPFFGVPWAAPPSPGSKLTSRFLLTDLV